MSETIIAVENLGKRYRIRHQQQRERYATLRDTLTDKTKGVARRLWSAFRSPSSLSSLRSSLPTSEDFWALRDVSFDVKQGETLGIIGRNGAGKSTLLKILSRITEPTTGRVEITGRVASLLEVGTGFHPELTGRENIFLNGAILGMHRAEIRNKFDEIVAFAEVEKFLDTPVKRYSSGMYVRLAFAVAAHLEPEILIVDEVLAVGDVRFQKKSLGKMQDVAQGGRTVLFVSHNLQTIRQLCQRVLLMHEGRLAASGVPYETISCYMGHAAGCNAGAIDLVNYPREQRHESVRLLRIEFLDPAGGSASQLPRHTDLTVKVHFAVERPVGDLDIPMAVLHVEGQRVFSEVYSDQFEKLRLSPGEYVVRFTLPLRFLKLESYFLTVGLFNGGRHCDLVENLPLPELVDETMDPETESRRWGVVRIPVSWTQVEVAPEGVKEIVTL
jgi:lipopolysaccharide transport system ATP-binding protein